MNNNSNSNSSNNTIEKIDLIVNLDGGPERDVESSTKFRGFGDDVSYIPTNTREGSICKACPNECQLHFIEVPSVKTGKTKRLIYGDACDRFQQKAQKIELREIEDLLDFRKGLLLKEYPPHPQADTLRTKNMSRHIGIPAGLKYWTDYPFWSTFFKSLGLSIIVSKENNPNAFENADTFTNIDSCLPLKMYYDLVGDLVENPDVTDIFVPSILNLNPLSNNSEKSQTCPLVATVNYMVKFHYFGQGNELEHIQGDIENNKKFLNPEFVFDVRYTNKKNRIFSRKLTYGSDNEIVRQLYEFAGPEFNVSKKQVKYAYETAMAAQREYVAAKREKGKQILEELTKRKEHAIVLFGRSYNSFDKNMNMNIDTEIRRLNWQVIPFDFLPIEKAELPKTMYENNNWFYQGNLLAGGDIVKNHPFLHGIYITNFKCGSDGFIIKDMQRILFQAGKLMVLEIDDLVNGTGYRTRIEAFLRSITLAKQKRRNSKTQLIDLKPFNSHLMDNPPIRYTEKDLRKKRVMVPLLSDHSIIVAGALRADGIDAMHFPLISDEEMEVGRTMSNGKECLPYTITAGEIICGLENEVKNGYNPKDLAVLWMITQGPCRFNQYAYPHQFYIDQHDELFGAKMINLVPVGSNAFNAYSPRVKLKLQVIKSYLVGDYMQQMLHQIRPYEIHTPDVVELKKEYREKILSLEHEKIERYFPLNALDGDIRHLKLSDLIYQVYLREVSDVISSKDKFELVIQEFITKMGQIPQNRTVKKPLIGLVGEIYLRFNPFSNGDIIRKLESLGAEVHLAPFAELIFYGTITLRSLGDSLFGSISDKISRFAVSKVDKSVFKLFEGVLTRPDFGQGRDADEIVRYGRQYIRNAWAGEGPLTLGAIEDYARLGADGMIMIGPMGCLPNITFKGLFEQVKEFLPLQMKDMPRMEITVSESLNFKNILTRIEPFVNQARDYLERKDPLEPNH